MLTKYKYSDDSTFCLLVLAISCLLRYRRRHNINACIVNMVFERGT